MSKAAIDSATGCLTIDGKKVFPLIVSDAPPQDGLTPEGKNAWAEIANSGRGINFIRSGRNLKQPWQLASVDAQINEERARLDLAHQHGMYGWLRLVNAANLPAAAAGGTASEPEQ